MALEDLSEFQARWVDPISASYRGWAVYEIPPNGQGISALAMLSNPSALPALVVTLTHLPRQWQNEIKRFLPALTGGK